MINYLSDPGFWVAVMVVEFSLGLFLCVSIGAISAAKEGE